MWITVVLGTIIGIVFGLGQGLGKLLPFLPFNKAASHGFANVWGPFLGLPGTPLRIFIGLGETVAGLGLLVGLWGDAYDAFDESLSNTVKALAIVAGFSLMTCAFVAAFVHKYVDGTAGMALPGVMGILCLIFTLIRVFCVEPETWASQMLATWLVLIDIVLAIITLIINRMSGKHESEVEDENKKLQEMK